MTEEEQQQEQARLQEAAELALAEHKSLAKMNEATQKAREAYRQEKEQRSGKK